MVEQVSNNLTVLVIANVAIEREVMASITSLGNVLGVL